MTEEKLPPSVDLLTIFRELSLLLPESVRSELANTLGKGGKESKTDSADTLMLWFATLSQKEQENLVTQIRGYITPLTVLGMRSPDSNSS